MERKMKIFLYDFSCRWGIDLVLMLILQHIHKGYHHMAFPAT